MANNLPTDFPDHLPESEVKWRKIAALITQIQKMLSQVDFQEFITQCEMKSNEIANSQGDISDMIRKKAAVEAFGQKARALRIAYNNLSEISIEFKKNHGNKQNPNLENQKNGQIKGKEEGNGTEK